MVTVVVTDEFEAWMIRDLSKQETKACAVLIGLLEDKGVTLGHPYSSAIMGATSALRELRVKKSAIRIFYAFDPLRQAVLLLGGSKEGVPSDRFYASMIERSEAIWKRYLATLAK
jgi:hypothetical protein